MIFTLTNNIKNENIYSCHSQKEYARRTINIKKNNKEIKDIKKNIGHLCSIRNESFVKYYDGFIDNKNNKIELLIEPYLPIHAHI